MKMYATAKKKDRDYLQDLTDAKKATENVEKEFADWKEAHEHEHEEKDKNLHETK